MSIHEDNHPSKKRESTLIQKGQTIAVTGKGGTGKTMLTTLMLRCLVEKGDVKILAVDADSAVSLPYALGVEIGKTVAELRQEIIDYPEVKRRIADEHIRKAIGNLLLQGIGFDLLVMGRPEAPGCFCAVNELLRYGIDTLAQDYDITIIDGEAGPEQINRRVIESIDTLLVVADASNRSLQTAATIKEVAQGHPNVKVNRIGLVINRFKGKKRPSETMTQEMGMEILGYIPEDQNVTDYDAGSRPLLEIPGDSPSLLSIHNILQQIR